MRLRRLVCALRSRGCGSQDLASATQTATSRTTGQHHDCGWTAEARMIKGKWWVEVRYIESDANGREAAERWLL
jgi:hypothetical protein